MACAYATLDDVQDRMPQFPLSATSKPTATTAQKFLDDVHAEVEGALENMGYVVPLVLATSPKSFRQVVAMECLGTSARILFARAAAVGGEASVASAERMQKQYDDMLCALRSSKDPRELSDAPRSGDQISKPQHVMTSSVANLLDDTDGEGFDPRCTMGQVF